MTKDDLFKTNASIIRHFAAIFCVVTNLVNSTLPVAAETLRKAGVFNPARLFSVTTSDVVRVSTFIAHALGDT
ncbi:uncharacterized protein ACHE_41132S [Aspergillus chevalieri]|uniref:Uncharacterized protein n=1 Tax=Aspergillus chevalieri TaxID=182096 RepID=A0A7R7VR35_ASPCH|nr:uncharacterized protein ACHE_41132S [Aspergillus chevalieri]BCR88568.1 hypothetical protein ACHE_41132S [Aspergillus chevalieri]